MDMHAVVVGKEQAIGTPRQRFWRRQPAEYVDIECFNILNKNIHTCSLRCPNLWHSTECNFPSFGPDVGLLQWQRSRQVLSHSRQLVPGADEQLGAKSNPFHHASINSHMSRHLCVSPCSYCARVFHFAHHLPAGQARTAELPVTCIPARQGRHDGGIDGFGRDRAIQEQ